MIWPIIITICLFFGGLIVLGLAADYLVTALLKAANIMHVPVFVIGSLILAIGTALPELANNVVAAMENVADLGMGNLIGSSLANIGLTLAIMLIVCKATPVSKKDKSEFLFSLIPLGVLFLFAFDGYVGRIEGLILLAIYFGHQFLLFKGGISRAQEHILLRRLMRPYAIVPLAIFSVILGAFLVVDTATSIAQVIGVPVAVISLTVLSIGTTLPEMSATVSALRKKEHELAFGNLFGSVAANSLLVLGLIATIFTLRFNFALFRIPLIILICLLAFLNAYTLIKKRTDRVLGICLISGYVLFVVISILSAIKI